MAAPAGLDWVCVSPKAGSTLVQTSGHELKVVVPQAGFTEADLLAFEKLAFGQRRVQPMDSASPQARLAATEWAVQWCLDHPAGCSVSRRTRRWASAEAGRIKEFHVRVESDLFF